MQESIKTRKQIAKEYGVCTRTFRRWLNREKLNIPSGDLSPKSQDLIYNTFGLPRLLEVKNNSRRKK